MLFPIVGVRGPSPSDYDLSRIEHLPGTQSLKAD